MRPPFHLLHGGYFLRQARNHGKQPQVHQSICHPEVHHLQDLKRDVGVTAGSERPLRCGSSRIYPVDVDLFFFGQQLRRDDGFESEQNLQAGDVAVTVAVLLYTKNYLLALFEEASMEKC